MRLQEVPSRSRPSARCWDQYLRASTAPSSSGPFSCCFTFGRCLEGRERFVPEAIEPLADLIEARRVDRVESPRALGTVGDQPRLLEHPQVLRHGRTANINPLGTSY